MKLEAGGWTPTALREPHDLIWSNYPDPQDRYLRIDGGVDQLLDVVMSAQTGNKLWPTLTGLVLPNNAVNVFDGGGTFRFDVAVAAEGLCRSVTLSLRVTKGARWDDVQAEAVS
jgi:hypothetical protein